ncbi:Enhanced RNAI (RNA interference) [Caenorhabditis elegans]|uniref:Enhanced RNAI (RNA interference) n=1 Tax=Caenorhabditis elegans TaxID=6239 RepID=Q17415_CAEEL|nr:Enhanced RNAI (RNA interference) [Caenorhabditis elegans]CAA93455.2 Enhanced RNAI (RNA interference) [Caenorhabditis elegans]|eukprot:NP_502310.2 Enhanced RNAI (RNA interference) [Caenorhabditis elegans]
MSSQKSGIVVQSDETHILISSSHDIFVADPDQNTKLGDSVSFTTWDIANNLKRASDIKPRNQIVESVVYEQDQSLRLRLKILGFYDFTKSQQRVFRTDFITQVREGEKFKYLPKNAFFGRQITVKLTHQKNSIVWELDEFEEPKEKTYSLIGQIYYTDFSDAYVYVPGYPEPFVISKETNFSRSEEGTWVKFLACTATASVKKSEGFQFLEKDLLDTNRNREIAIKCSRKDGIIQSHHFEKVIDKDNRLADYGVLSDFENVLIYVKVSMEGVSKKPSLILGQFQTSFNVNPTLTRDQKEALDPPKRILKKQSSLPREGSSRKQVTQIQNLSRKIETGPRINFLPNFNNQDHGSEFFSDNEEMDLVPPLENSHLRVDPVPVPIEPSIQQNRTTTTAPISAPARRISSNESRRENPNSQPAPSKMQNVFREDPEAEYKRPERSNADNDETSSTISACSSKSRIVRENPDANYERPARRLPTPPLEANDNLEHQSHDSSSTDGLRDTSPVGNNTNPRSGSPSCHSDTHSSVSSSLWITTINSSKDLEFVKNEYIKLWIEDQASQKEMKNLKAKRIELKMKQKKLKAELNDEKMKNQKLEEAAFNDRKEKAELKKKVSNLEQSAQNTQRTLQNQTRELNLYSTNRSWLRKEFNSTNLLEHLRRNYHDLSKRLEQFAFN